MNNKDDKETNGIPEYGADRYGVVENPFSGHDEAEASSAREWVHHMANGESIPCIEKSAFVALQAEVARMKNVNLELYKTQESFAEVNRLLKHELTASQAKVVELEQLTQNLMHIRDTQDDEYIELEKERDELCNANLRETNYAADLKIENDALKDQLQWSLKNEEQYKTDIKQALGKNAVLLEQIRETETKANKDCTALQKQADEYRELMVFNGKKIQELKQENAALRRMNAKDLISGDIVHELDKYEILKQRAEKLVEALNIAEQYVRISVSAFLYSYKELDKNREIISEALHAFNQSSEK